MLKLKITYGKYTSKSKNTQQVDSSDCGNPNSGFQMGRAKKLVGFDGDLAAPPELGSLTLAL